MRQHSCRPVGFLAATLAALAIVCHAPALQAAGLGEARALSAVGEPLRVRIELVMAPGERPDAIKARVTSPSIDAASAAPAGNALTASVVATAEGKAGVMVRSAGTVYRPYVELIVAVSSPAGHSDRSFVVALPTVRPGIAAAGPARAAPVNTGVAVAPSPAAAPASAPAAVPSPAAPPTAAAAQVQSAAPPAQVEARAPVRPPQRQAAENAAPPPAAAAQPNHAEPNRSTRAGAARGERRSTPAEPPKSDGSVVISAIGDYATVSGDSGTSGAAQSRTYRALTPEEEASGQPASLQPETCCAPSPTSPPVQPPAGVPPQGPGDAASGVATGQQPVMHAEVPPQTTVQVAAAPAAPPTVDEPSDPDPASAAQPAPAQGAGDEMPAAAAAGKAQRPSTETPAGTPDAASGKRTWTYLELGLALLVLVLAGAVAYLALKRKAG